MPIYEFQCNNCEGIFEEMRRITDDSLPGCPSCESDNVRKLISLSAFHLKGTGWYVTDYGTKKNGVAGAEDGDGKGNGDAKEKGAEESKSTPAEGEGKSESTAKSTTKTSDSPKEAKPKSSGQSTPSK
jgi:putative FmdB family regulatory protein